MRNIISILVVMITVCFCALPARTDDFASSEKEYRVKAAFLYNFVKFVEWPGEQSLGKTHTANICILGDNPFGGALNLFKQASTAQLGLNVKANISEDGITGCNILFISRSEDRNVSSVLARARSRSILTVSEIPGFADSGGIIEMVKSEQNIGLFFKDKINLRINVKAAEAAGLHIDAQLLEIAAEVIK